MPSTPVTKRPIGFCWHSRRFASLAIVEMPECSAADDSTADCDAAMNSAAATPLPDTSPSTKNRVPSDESVNSTKSPPICWAGVMRADTEKAPNSASPSRTSASCTTFAIERSCLMASWAICRRWLLVCRSRVRAATMVSSCSSRLKTWTVMSEKTRARLPSSSVRRITSCIASLSGCLPVSTCLAASAMTSMGRVSQRVPPAAAKPVRASRTKAMMTVLRVSSSTVSAMSSRFTAMARPPMGMPPVLMRGDATQMPRSSGDKRLRLAALTTRRWSMATSMTSAARFSSKIRQASTDSSAPCCSARGAAAARSRSRLTTHIASRLRERTRTSASLWYTEYSRLPDALSIGMPTCTRRPASPVATVTYL